MPLHIYLLFQYLYMYTNRTLLIPSDSISFPFQLTQFLLFSFFHPLHKLPSLPSRQIYIPTPRSLAACQVYCC